MTIDELIEKSYDNARRHGFWDEPKDLPTTVALLHEEVSEVFGEYRDGHRPEEIYYPTQTTFSIPKPEGIPIELADLVIRIADTCGYYGIDLEEAIRIKMVYNETRPFKHGRKL